MVVRLNHLESLVYGAKRHFEGMDVGTPNVQLQEVTDRDVLFHFNFTLKPRQLAYYAVTNKIKTQGKEKKDVAERVLVNLYSSFRSKFGISKPSFVERDGEFNFTFPVYFKRAILAKDVDLLLETWHKSHLAIRNHLSTFDMHYTDVSDDSGNLPMQLDPTSKVSKNFDPHSYSLLSGLLDHFTIFNETSKRLSPSSVFSTQIIK